jgi:sodium bicarbonate transporter 10
MIVVRKLLDYVFSQRELKILDDIMPENTKRKEEEELRMKDDFIETEVGKTLAIGESGNLQIPLANGNVMKIPLSSVNITEEVNKTGIWKQVNNVNTKDSPTKESRSKKDKVRETW